MTKKTYIDFYEQTETQIVSREIRSTKEFFQSRQALYLALGIVPLFISGRDVIEFGPGAGHNTLYTDSLRPRKLVLVDGVKKVLDAARKRLEVEGSAHTQREYKLEYFEDYASDDKYDLVIAEACVPTQKYPAELLKRLGTFVNAGGLLFTTTVSGVSYLSEILRQLVKEIRFSSFPAHKEQLEVLRPLLGPHLLTLKNMARSHDDWLIDNIVQTHTEGLLFSIPESVEALKQNYVMVGSSPRFLTDWRWYRDIHDDGCVSNQLAVDAYHRTCINLMDFRYIRPPHDVELGREIESRCAAVWNFRTKLASGDRLALNHIWAEVKEISLFIRAIAPETSSAINEAVSWLQDGAPDTSLKHFPNWWGRGQQYISFVRTH